MASHIWHTGNPSELLACPVTQPFVRWALVSPPVEQEPWRPTLLS